MNDLGVTGMTVTQVMGCGIQKGAGERYRGVEIDATLLPKVKLEVVVSSIPVDDVIETAKKALYTGHIGDGKIFVYPVNRVVKIRTGEENYAALQDVKYNRKLILEDGSEYLGTGFGSGRDAVCEIVFNTSMAGYQEILSDPSYTDQAVVMSYPLIGNYGITDEDFESKCIAPSAVIVRDLNENPSNFRATGNLDGASGG